MKGTGRFRAFLADRRVQLSVAPFVIAGMASLVAIVSFGSVSEESADFRAPTIKPITFNHSAVSQMDAFYTGAYRIIAARSFHPEAPSIQQLLKNGDLKALPPEVGNGSWALGSGETVELRSASQSFCSLMNYGNPPAPSAARTEVSGCYRNFDGELTAFYREKPAPEGIAEYQLVIGTVEDSGEAKRLRIVRERNISPECPDGSWMPENQFLVQEFRGFRVCVPVSKEGAKGARYGVFYEGDRWNKTFRGSGKQVRIGVFL